MRSKTSCFNGTLFRKNLSRYWPLWGLASFGGAMFPLAMRLELLHNGFRFWSPLETRQAYYTVLSYGVPVISIVYAILCAMAVWSYLYNARSVGMMHTLPPGGTVCYQRAVRPDDDGHSLRRYRRADGAGDDAVRRL